jgi:hypothetical protein
MDTCVDLVDRLRWWSLGEVHARVELTEVFDQRADGRHGSPFRHRVETGSTGFD